MSKQSSLRRLREFGVRPNRELGQNFLIDDNILRLIGDAAELGPEDVVLEVGGGLGVLSEHLAPRVAALHVVEVDEGLREALLDAVGEGDGVQLHFADALDLDYSALDPTPKEDPAFAVFTPDAGSVLIATPDGSVARWDLGAATWIERACVLAGRNLTEPEWTELIGDRPYRTVCP